jgi:hypothetical protein
MNAEDLYGLPLDRFVAERDALARALRADGRREEAAAVGALRKPSVVAWAVNQLVRTQGRALAELFDAGDALREAQEDILAGRGDGQGLRAAAERERAAVDALVNAARGLLTSDGHELSAAVIDRVADTAHAAAFDDAARAEVRGGRLERELHHAGLGISAGTGPAMPARSTRPTPAGKPAGAKGRTRPAGRRESGVADTERTGRERIAEARRVEEDRAEGRRRARVAESEARRSADRAARALRVAEERRERAAQELRAAEEALSSARADAEAAATAHRAAEDVLKRT